MNYDGALISELGVKQYLSGHKAQTYANIDFFKTQKSQEKDWTTCNFGCHTPSYRVLRRSISRHQFLSSMNKLSPVLAGVAAGIEHQTSHKVTLLGAGIARTGEGLGMAGSEHISTVGEENVTAYSIVKVSLQKLWQAELSSIDNPLTQLVLSVVYEYIKLIPEWVVAEAIDQNAIVFPDSVDKQFIINASNRGFIDQKMIEHLDAAAMMLKNPAMRLVSKQVTKKLVTAVACIIASNITRKIMTSPGMTLGTKKRIANLRKTARTSKGSAGTTLILLLKTNGWLGISAKESRQLQQSCPRLWRFLRFRCGGLDMLLFLASGSIQEYIDRISILEKNPKNFAKLMEALILSGNTSEIFLPR